MNWIHEFFSSGSFMPHGHCYLWLPGVLWLHVISDSLITLAYFSIPFTLVYFVRKRRDLEFHWMFICFAVFIVACGTTHLMEIWVIWHPTYWVSGSIKALTALASVPTAILLVKLIPKALLLPSPAALRKVNVELEKSNAELVQFAYVASHDLQEPLRAVAGCAQLLQKVCGTKLDERANELIRHTVEGAMRMQTLIEDLLAVSRVNTTTEPLKQVDSNASLKLALTNLAITIRESGAVIKHDTLPKVNGDAGQLAQLFQNLIGNGIKFRKPEGNPEIEIKAQRNGGNWLFKVHDNGIGIAPEYKDRIFAIFQRLHTREVYSGTGIGLAICKRIVERHAGDIWVESEIGKGSTFCFTIPATSHMV